MPPIWWKSRLGDVDEILATAKKGKVSLLCTSPGNRKIEMISYGKPFKYERTANYSSALGAKDITCYKKRGAYPSIVLIGSTHGFEFEGTVSLLNLISLFETGHDLAGNKNDALSSWCESAHITIIPMLNPDGRERVPFETAVGLDRETFRRYAQGEWLDGTMCDWPVCKAYHPIKPYVKRLGGYYNDDGVNIVHDNFFAPMSQTTRSLLNFVEKTAPDMVVDMHGHASAGDGYILPSAHLSNEQLQHWLEFEKLWIERMSAEGFKYRRTVQWHIDQANEKGSFNIADAVSVICGALSAAYESDQGVTEGKADIYPPTERHERIYRKHMLFYECVKDYAAALYRKKEE